MFHLSKLNVRDVGAKMENAHIIPWNAGFINVLKTLI
jgi:hypothetical protein